MENQIKAHYNTRNLITRIYHALEKAKKNLDRLSLKDLAPIDQLHTGGAKATLALLEQAHLKSGSDVLDAGCGLGGSSRLMAKNFGYMVTGVDLSDQFVTAAQALTGSMRLSDQVYFKQGSIEKLPFENKSFDAILCQHVLMNIMDKEKAFKEFNRVLRSNGKLILHEIVKGENDPVMYPVPWADQEKISYLQPWDAMEMLIKNTGFEKENFIDGTPGAATWWEKVKNVAGSQEEPQKVLGPHLVFGENAALFGKTMNYNFKWKRIKLVEAVFKKKG
ncbi:MAG: class I SAM-dependent methyltransferase [Pseudomonadota bacterium]